MEKKFSELEHTGRKRGLVSHITKIWYHYMFKKTLQFLKKNDGDWLDVGCGEGYLFDNMQEWKGNIYGVDADPDQIKKIQNKSVKAVVGIAENIPFEKEFDVVSALGLLEHVTDYNKVFDEIIGKCKKNGIILIMIPIEWQLTIAKVVLRRPKHPSVYTRFELIRGLNYDKNKVKKLRTVVVPPVKMYWFQKK